MGLREQAIADCAAIVADADGFGWPITVTDPAGTSAELTGLSTDISQAIDPDTGVVVSGRGASVALSMSALTAAGLGMPKGIADSGSKPWVVAFADAAGVTNTYKIADARPDRALGLVVCVLEGYEP